jgi:hypothetical protein
VGLVDHQEAAPLDEQRQHPLAELRVVQALRLMSRRSTASRGPAVLPPPPTRSRFVE